MCVFQHVLWGYELTYPDPWHHLTKAEVECFAAIPEALDPEYHGANSGQILIRCEWNSVGKPIEPLWNRHIGMLASWLGAKEVGSAPWRLGVANGLEAEIVMPKKDDRRLWTGILQKDLTVLHFVVLHLKQEYEIFQHFATEIISSLRFPAEVAGVFTNSDGLPLPPNYETVPAEDFLSGILEPAHWRAYDGASSIEALQAFYLSRSPKFRLDDCGIHPIPQPIRPGLCEDQVGKEWEACNLGALAFRRRDGRTFAPGKNFS